jgi:hypothetical protein
MRGDVCSVITLATIDLYFRRKISASMGYVAVRGEGKIDGAARGEQDALCDIVSPPSPYLSRLATTRIFVTVNETRRYLATSIST